MKSLKSKILALFTIACMFTGAVGVYADDYGSSTQNQTQYKVDFGQGSWIFNEVTVTAATGDGDGLVPLKGETEISEDTVITLIGFNPDTMEVRVSGADNFSTLLNVVNNQTSLSTKPENVNLPDILSFSVNMKPGEVKPDEFTVNFGEGKWTFGENIVTADKTGEQTNTSSTEISLTGFDSATMEAKVRANDGFTASLSVVNGKTSLSTWNGGLPNSLTFTVETTSSEGTNPSDPPQGTEDMIESSLIVTGSIDMYINDSGMKNYKDENSKADSVKYTHNETEETVTFRVANFINERYTKIIINGTDYAELLPDPTTVEGRESMLNALQDQIYVYTFTVPYSNEYVITAEKEEISGESPYSLIGNFLWSYDEENSDGTPVPEDQYIGNGTMELLKISYDGKDYVPGTELPSWIVWGQNEHGGSAVIPANATVTVKMIPYYGYQLMNLSINDQAFKAEDAQSVFTFTVKKGNFHLGAKFEETKNLVTSSSGVVKTDGTEVNITNGENNFIDSGTVKLTVADNTDENNIDDFNQNLPEELDGYEVNNVLDIGMDQIFYKGSADDYWTNSVSDLNGDTAEISINVGMGYDGVQVIHETHNGDTVGYEALGTTYQDGILTFKTGSFSRFAFASKIADPNVTFDIRSFEEEDNGSVQLNGENVTAYQGYPVDLSNAEVKLFPPQIYADTTPIVLVGYGFTDGTYRMLKPEVGKTSGSDGVFTFVFPAVEKRVSGVDVIVYWNKYDSVEPWEGEMLVETCIPQGSEYGSVKFDREYKETVSTSDNIMTKYLFDVEEEGKPVNVEIIPAAGKLIQTVYVDGECYGEDFTGETPEDMIYDLSKLLVGDKYIVPAGIGSAWTPIEVHFINCSHGSVTEYFLAPTYKVDGHKSYYECDICGTYYNDEECTQVITDLESWKANEGLLPCYEPEYLAYKDARIAEVNGILKDDDSDTVKSRISLAATTINGMSYDETKTPLENQAAIKAVVDNAKADIEVLRENETPFEVYKTQILTTIGNIRTENDSDATSKLITDAETAIKALTYDVTKTSEANKEAVNAIVTKLTQDLETQQIKEAKGAFETYKTEKTEYVESLKSEGDSTEVSGLISNAKAAITALAYDETKSLEENKTAVDNIVTKVETDVKAQRRSEAKAVFETYKNDRISYINSLGVSDDPQSVATLISGATIELEILAYDETKSLSANKEAADKIVAELETRIRNVRLGEYGVTLPPSTVIDSIVNVTNSANNALNADVTLQVSDFVGAGQVFISLDAKEADPQQSEGAKGLLADSLKTYQAGMFLEFNLEKYSNLGVYQGRITELEKAVTIELTLPENLINTSPNVTREYRIGRIHEYLDSKKKAEILRTEFDATSKTLSFVTDRFSTYVIMYRDIPNSVPDTSDHSNTALWMAVLMLSGIVAAGTVVFRRKRS